VGVELFALPEPPSAGADASAFVKVLSMMLKPATPPWSAVTMTSSILRGEVLRDLHRVIEGWAFISPRGLPLHRWR
jgi:hypothetical protein